MGKEYWYWGGKSASKRGREAVVVDGEATSSVGCMCAVFQLFDFHQFQLANLNQAKPSFKPSTTSTFLVPEEEPNSPKGICFF